MSKRTHGLIVAATVLRVLTMVVGVWMLIDLQDTDTLLTMPIPVFVGVLVPITVIMTRIASSVAQSEHEEAAAGLRLRTGSFVV